MLPPDIRKNWNTSPPVAIQDGYIPTTKPDPRLHGFGLPNMNAIAANTTAPAPCSTLTAGFSLQERCRFHNQVPPVGWIFLPFQLKLRYNTPNSLTARKEKQAMHLRQIVIRSPQRFLFLAPGILLHF